MCNAAAVICSCPPQTLVVLPCSWPATLTRPRLCANSTCDRKHTLGTDDPNTTLIIILMIALMITLMIILMIPHGSNKKVCTCSSCDLKLAIADASGFAVVKTSDNGEAQTVCYSGSSRRAHNRLVLRQALKGGFVRVIIQTLRSMMFFKSDH